MNFSKMSYQAPQFGNNFHATKLKSQLDLLKIEQKNQKCFITFDVVNFYPGIKYHYLIKAINFASTYADTEDKDIKLIEHTCTTILNYNNKIWIKKDEKILFNVPMGSFFWH